MLDRAADQSHPLCRELSARGGDADEQRVGLQREPLVDRGDDGNVATEAEHLLRGRARLARVEHADDVIGGVANAGVGGLGGLRPEVAVGQDQIARSARHAACGESAVVMKGGAGGAAEIYTGAEVTRRSSSE